MAKVDPATVTIEASRTNHLRCFSCNEIGHRQPACPTRNRCDLLLDAFGRDVEIELDDDAVPDEPYELEADTGVSLMLRRSCLAPRLPVEYPQCNALFQSRCTIEEKLCKFIIDSGSSQNMIATDAAQKLGLTAEEHPHPYHLAWLQQTNEVRITRRALVAFPIGDAYHDWMYCDVVPMDAYHLLLGHLWEFDRRVTHDGFLNTYSFKFNNHNFTLKSSTPLPLPPPTTSLLLMQKAPFEVAMQNEGRVIMLVATPSSPAIDQQVRPKFSDIHQIL